MNCDAGRIRIWPLLLAATVLLLSFFKVTAFQCFGIDSIDPAVCGGKGTCIFDDFCECMIGVTGLNCTLVDCGWMHDSIGAPQPAVDAKVKDQRVLIDVLISKRTGVKHRIDFRENLLCSSTDPMIAPNSQWFLKEETSCYVRYSLNRTLQDHLNDPAIEKQYGEGDIFQAVSPIYASYLDLSEELDCALTTFKTEWTINIYLQAVSTATFGNTNDPIGKLRQDRIRVLDDGRLEILATLTLHAAGQLSNFNFSSSSVAGVGLFVNGTVMDSNCGNQGQSNCKYAMSIQSTKVKSDYSGRYTFNAALTRSTGTTQMVDITFLLQYATPVPPAATNMNLTTRSTFYGADFTASKTVFSTLDDAWLLTEIVESVSIPTKALTYRNVYLCCMEDRGPMPEYDPAAGKYGCASRTESMDIWVQLVSQEQLLVPLYNTKLKKLAFIDDKVGLSFSLLPLVGENRLCYIQVETFLKTKASKRRWTRANSDDEAAIASFTPLQVITASTTQTPPTVFPIGSHGTKVKSAATINSTQAFLLLPAVTALLIVLFT